MATTIERTSTRRVGVFAAVAAAVALCFALVASPAYAAGSFNVKATPGGCTQTDFKGSSSGNTGYTQHANVICATHLLVSVQLTKNGATAPRQTSTGGYISSTLAGSGTITGKHQLCVWQAASFWYNCDFTRNT